MTKGPVSTCEGAAARRAFHALYERPPVFDDSWAVKMVGRRSRWSLRIPVIYRTGARERIRSGRDNIVAFALGCFRLTDEVVERACAEGVSQYLILSAGLDSFALRRSDLPVQVFELDHPAPQAMKRRRVMRAVGHWPGNLELVPIDFEVTSIEEALKSSQFDTSKPAVASWLNSIPYLTKEATSASLAGLARVLAPTSRLVFNYPPRVRLSPTQHEAIAALGAAVERRGEPFLATYPPGEMSALVEGLGFVVEEHLTESDIDERYFRGRTSGPMPVLPGRVIVARRV